MKKSIKRVLSMLLVAILVLGSIPMMSYAETQTYYHYTGTDTSGSNVRITSRNYDNSTVLMKVGQIGNSNSFKAYCVDYDNNLESNEKYTMGLLQDLSYTSNSGFIRAVINKGYPNVTADDLKTAVNNGLNKKDKIKNLSDAQAVASTQAAIWFYANGRTLDTKNTNDDIVKVYNYLKSQSPMAAPSPAAIQTTTPVVSTDGMNIVIKFSYKNVLATPTISSLAGFTKTVTAGTGGYTDVTFKKSLSNATIADFGAFSITINGFNPITDAFAFLPENGRTSTQTLVSTIITQNRPVAATVNGNCSSLLGSVTVNKSFTDQASTEVAFELKAGNTVVKSGTTNGQTITWNNLIPGNYTLFETSPSRYISSIAGGYSISLSPSENEVVNVTNTPEPKTTITVHHVSETGSTLAEDDHLIGYADETYTAAAKTIAHYSVKTAPTVETGLYGTSNFELTYVYQEDPKSTVTAIYVDENDATLSPSVTTNDYVGLSYETSAKLINHYTLKEVPANASGNYAEDAITVKYVYQVNAKTTITVYHQDENGVTLAGTDTFMGFSDETYSTSAKIIAHYDLLTTPENASGTFGSDDFTLTYVYKENAKTTITVKYVDSEGTELATSDLLTGYADATYSTSPKSIANYSLSTTPDNANGTFGDTSFDVIYVYAPNDKLAITVKHVDKNLVEIASSDIIQGYPGDSYSSSSKSISGYQLFSTPENASGTFGESNFDVIYVYEVIVVPTETQTETQTQTQAPTEPTTQAPTQPQGPQGSVVVNFVDTDGVSIASSFSFTGSVGTLYQTSARTIDGYELVETPANATGSFIDGSVTVNYVYSNGVTVVDETTPLGDAIAPVNFDSIFDNMEVTTEATDEAVIVDEATPLADALPQTGQASPELFYGIGSIVSALGIYIKRKNK